MEHILEAKVTEWKMSSLKQKKKKNGRQLSKDLVH